MQNTINIILFGLLKKIPSLFEYLIEISGMVNVLKAKRRDDAGVSKLGLAFLVF